MRSPLTHRCSVFWRQEFNSSYRPLPPPKKEAAGNRRKVPFHKTTETGVSTRGGWFLSSFALSTEERGALFRQN